MRKIFAAFAVVALVFAAAPVLAATNPFMDVPMNHWAYDAIGQLAARGVLSGYPDGTYKGKQPTTRYEMASAVARALAVVDMTKASKQDVEMLKKLVIEFKDELDALGVKVDQLDKRVAVIENRLGGWKLSGTLENDLIYGKGPNYGTELNADGTPSTSGTDHGGSDIRRGRIHFDRWFGEDESIHFHARLRGDDGHFKDSEPARLRFDKFYVEAPAWFGTTLVVGRTNQSMGESAYTMALGKMSDGNTDDWMSDRFNDIVGLRKAFGMGTVFGYLSHVGGESNSPAKLEPYNNEKVTAWELSFYGSFQFNEQLGLDIGFQGFFGDGDSYFANDAAKFKSLYTLYGGLRFDFTQGVGLKGIFYTQHGSADDLAGNDYLAANDIEDSANAWKVIIDVKQDLLKFTSLWLEYAKVGKGFWFGSGSNALLTDTWDSAGKISPTFQVNGSNLAADVDLYRIGARQDWNSKWATYEFYTHLKADVSGIDPTLTQWGIGFEYKLNPSVITGLSYIQYSYDNDYATSGVSSSENDSQIRWRTKVAF